VLNQEDNSAVVGARRRGCLLDDGFVVQEPSTACCENDGYRDRAIHGEPEPSSRAGAGICPETRWDLIVESHRLRDRRCRAGIRRGVNPSLLLVVDRKPKQEPAAHARPGDGAAAP
jgi:hypothetical protein